MAKRPQFQHRHTPDGWQVDVPESMSRTGKRERRFFAAEIEAKKFAARLREQYHAGQRGGLIPLALALDAAEASRILEPHGATLTEAARAFATRLLADGSGETFSDRYDRALLENESIWRERYARDMAKVPRWVGKAFMAMRISEIGESAITAALKGHGAAAQSTIDMRAARVLAIIGHRTRHRRGETITIESVGTCARLLRACESPAERHAVALLLWAGIRPDAEDGEITRLQWECVGRDEIYVPAEVSKTGTDRHVPITPRLRRLLRGHETEGPVVPPNWKRVYQRLRRAAGITGQDTLRHTFASHFLAAFGIDAARQAMGHSKTSDTLLRHYRRAVTTEAGKRFFG
jgi:integrase